MFAKPKDSSRPRETLLFLDTVNFPCRIVSIML
jgi:hypothetical protein